MVLTPETELSWTGILGDRGGAKMEEAPSNATEKGIILLIAGLTWCLTL